MDLRTLTGEGLATRHQPQLAELLERKFEVAESDREQAEDKLNEYPEGSAEYLVWEEKHEKCAKVATRIYNVLERLESQCP